jgi:hypothetical protein
MPRAPAYRAIWADSLGAEKAAFEELVDLIQRQRAVHPAMHVYHYAPYEPSALKRLMCRHATRENEIDALLRSGAFVDLYAIVRQSVRAGVERYSIKDLEPLYGYAREVDLKDARRHLQAVELALELERLADLEPSVPRAVEGYNRDDCISALRLRDWLEGLRASAWRTGEIPRPSSVGRPSEELDERQKRWRAARCGCSRGRSTRATCSPTPRLHSREGKPAWWSTTACATCPRGAFGEPAAVAGSVVEDVDGQAGAVQRSRTPARLELRRGQPAARTRRWNRRVDRDRTIDVLVGPSKRNRALRVRHTLQTGDRAPSSRSAGRGQRRDPGSSSSTPARRSRAWSPAARDGARDPGPARLGQDLPGGQ